MIIYPQFSVLSLGGSIRSLFDSLASYDSFCGYVVSLCMSCRVQSLLVTISHLFLVVLVSL